MTDQMFPPATRETYQERTSLAPEINTAFREFSGEVFEEGSLSEKTKQLMAVAVGHVTQCPYCIRGHVGIVQEAGATREEVMEAIWVAAAVRADSTRVNSSHAFEGVSEEKRGTMTPDTLDSFRTFTDRVFDDGALSEQTKRLLAVSVAHALQCESCLVDQADHARDAGATDEELMEAMWVAVEMQAGGAYAHAAIAIDEMEDPDD
ncbi:carboxymuconolactone decarboxylase family protein [Halovenus halobia]|uniref:carboxymuconolactone decarboxylase family protein n=1 Tax=Halovenus halobia TaxID=3396622 RepID=UPI003F567E95